MARASGSEYCLLVLSLAGIESSPLKMRQTLTPSIYSSLTAMMRAAKAFAKLFGTLSTSTLKARRTS